MRDHVTLDRLYTGRPASPRDCGTVDLLVVRRAPGEHETPSVARLTPEGGLVGDRWVKGSGMARDVDRQITLMMTPVAELVCDGLALHLPGDNLLVNLDLGEDTLPIGSRLRVGAALLEVSSKPHNGCKKFLSRFGPGALDWVNAESGRTRKLRGVNCRVIEAGTVSVGDAIIVLR